MATGETIVLSYSIVAGIFAYLAINLSEEHGPIRILNLIMTYLTVFVIGFLSTSVLGGGNSQDVVTVFNNGYSWIFYMVVAYFMLYFLYQLFLWWSKEAEV